MNENQTFWLTMLRYVLVAICTFTAILTVGYRFGEAQRVKLISAAKDPMAVACALDQSSLNPIRAVAVAQSKSN